MELNSLQRYKISNKESKKAVVSETYENKSDPSNFFKRYETFESGWVEVDGEEGSYYLQNYSPSKGVDLYGASDGEFEFLNGVSDDWKFSEGIDDTIKDDVKNNWGNLDYINSNWTHTDTEYLFYGELSADEV